MEQTASFGYWLRRRRKALDLTQEALASQAGCTAGMIRRIEADERRPSRELAEHLARCLAIPPEERPAFVQAARAELATDQLGVGARPIDLPQAAPRRLDNLPAPSTLFVGRAREVATICTLLRRADVRLVTLTGPGGAGKTRLGLQVAAELLARDAPARPSPRERRPEGQRLFANGVWFVNLAPIGDPNLLASTIARVFDIRASGTQPLRERLIDYLRAKRLLLLLDNFEQIVDAAPLASDLLSAAPGLKILATSRMPLRLSGEHLFTVPPLTLPPAEHTDVQTLTRYEAVRLFVERAQAVENDFRLTNENAAAVAEICRRLDGLPLAIELAAAWIKLFPPRALLEHLDKRLALLTGGPRDLPARQQTIRDTIDWSYQLLSDDERVIFRRLAVFVGGCTLEAAEIIGDDGRWTMDDEQTIAEAKVIVNRQSSIVERIAALLDHSLLRQVEEPGGEPRFGMLETTREYALERLAASGEAEILRYQHARYYLALAEQAEPELYSANQLAWLDRLEQEHHNLRAALSFCVEANDALLDTGRAEPLTSSLKPQASSLADMGLRLAAALWWFWLIRGHRMEGLAWFDRVLERAGEAPARSRAKALNRAGDLADWLSEYEKAREYYEQSMHICETLDDTALRANALWGRATAAQHRGDLATAEALCQESLRLSFEIDDTWHAARVLCTMGMLAHARGHLERAAALYEDSARLARESGDRRALGPTVYAQADLRLIQHDQAGAIALLQESLALARQLDDLEATANTLNCLGEVARISGNLEQAASYYQKALALFQELGRPGGVGMVHGNLGFLALRQGDIALAAERFVESLPLCRSANHPQTVSSFSLLGLAEVAVAQGQFERAALLLGVVDKLVVANGDPSDQLGPFDRDDADRAIAAARAQLGDEAFAAAWQAGQAMTLDQAIDYAIERF